jgi:hypothetical protein
VTRQSHRLWVALERRSSWKLGSTTDSKPAASEKSGQRSKTVSLGQCVNGAHNGLLIDFQILVANGPPSDPPRSSWLIKTWREPAETLRANNAYDIVDFTATSGR